MATSPQSLVTRWPAALMDNYGPAPLGIVSGSGSTLVDDEGRRYLDLLGGIAVTSLGHAHPGVAEAISLQASQLIHCSNLFASEPVIAAGEKLIDRFCRGDADAASNTRVFFCNSGAEANEAAFKLARLTGRRRILAAHHGFHGRTMGSLAMTGQPAKRDLFAPLPGGVEFFPFGDAEYLSKMVAINPADTAAIIVEPIQGETGVVPAPDGFLSHIRALCDEHGILFIVDEVQTGIGRTGDFFAHQHESVTPDVVTMAKGLGAGMPIGACLATGRAARLFTPGAHGTTFGGNPVCCAAANVVLDTVDDVFVAEVARKGHTLSTRLETLEHVDHVRGRGLMLGVVLDKPVAKDCVRIGYKHGLILNAPNESVLRLTPPLVITDDELDRAVTLIDSVLAEAAA